jgi:hypothetical protein
MENRKQSKVARQAEELFAFYDRARIGVITKKALLYYFGSTSLLMQS